jgi:hypothetical protein
VIRPGPRLDCCARSPQVRRLGAAPSMRSTRCCQARSPAILTESRTWQPTWPRSDAIRERLFAGKAVLIATDDLDCEYIAWCRDSEMDWLCCATVSMWLYSQRQPRNGKQALTAGTRKRLFDPAHPKTLRQTLTRAQYYVRPRRGAASPALHTARWWVGSVTSVPTRERRRAVGEDATGSWLC